MIGVGSGGSMLGPLLAQKKQIPFIPMNYSGPSQIDYINVKDLADKRVLIVDMNLNYENMMPIQFIISAISEHCQEVAGLFVPTMLSELAPIKLSTNVATMQLRGKHLIFYKHLKE